MDKNINKAQLGIMLEKECINKFRNSGWTIVQPEKAIMISPSHFFRPDFLLQSNNGYEGIVEVKSYKSILLNESQIAETIERLLSLKPDFLIITNGVTYDLYTFGNYYGRLSLIPHPEDIDLILSDFSKERK